MALAAFCCKLLIFGAEIGEQFEIDIDLLLFFEFPIGRRHRLNVVQTELDAPFVESSRSILVSALVFVASLVDELDAALPFRDLHAE